MQPQNKAVSIRMLRCSNTACGRTFTLPLKTLNLQVSSEPYDACPFCLTKVTLENEYVIVEKATDDFKPELNVELSQEQVECPYHFGYLSERQVKDQIPDECLICKSIMRCTLKKIES